MTIVGDAQHPIYPIVALNVDVLSGTTDAMLMHACGTVRRMTMATEQLTVAQALAKRYADLVSDQPAVRELWVVTRTDIPELWLILDPLSDDAERELYQRSVELHDERQPVLVELRSLIADQFPEVKNLRELLPTGAEPVFQRAA
jgi:hypothetical protein